MLKNNQIPTPMSSGGVNDYVVSKIISYIKQHSKKHFDILDLATGKGYNVFLLKKLMKKFPDISVSYKCVDLNAEDFSFTGEDDITFISADLNTDVDLGKFDIIIGTEIIEHLENPYHFIRLLTNHLQEGGRAYISSPNIENIISYSRNLLVGLPMRFGVNEPSGHIMPVYKFMVEEAIRRVNKEQNKKYKLIIDFNRSFIPIWFGKWMLFTLPIRIKQLAEINVFEIYHE